MTDFSQFSLTINLLIFAISAVVVWIAGTKLTYYADALAEMYKLSRALLGLILLAGVTSLPEIATSFTAALSNNAELAVNNLLGSIAMQVAVLAVADGAFGGRALTSVVPDPVVILQGAVNIFLLALVVMAILVGDKSFMGAGLWTWSLALLAFFCLKKIAEGVDHKPWHIDEKDQKLIHDAQSNDMPYAESSSQSLIIKVVISAVAILIAGFVVARTGDAIAQQSGLGASFVGVSLVAIATSLPEASTVFASVRRGLYTMAISDILGTNILNVVLIFVVDLLTDGQPVLSTVGEFAAVAAVQGAIVVSIFLIGLAERRDRTVFRFGRDSLAVLAAYVIGMVLLFSMRS